MADQSAIPATGWVPAWADLQERPAEREGTAFVLGNGTGDAGEGQEYVVPWPGPGVDQIAATVAGLPGARLTLVCADAGAAEAPADLAQVSRRLLLQAPTAELDTGVQLPENSQVALAPMETYDAVEITVFDRPVARGRIQVRDDFAAVAITELPDGPEGGPFERALFAAMAEEAFLHGAAYLHMVVGPDDAARYEASGWAVAGHVVGFQKT